MGHVITVARGSPKPSGGISGALRYHWQPRTPEPSGEGSDVVGLDRFFFGTESPRDLAPTPGSRSCGRTRATVETADFEQVPTVWIGRREGESKNTFVRDLRYVRLALEVLVGPGNPDAVRQKR